MSPALLVHIQAHLDEDLSLGVLSAEGIAVACALPTHLPGAGRRDTQELRGAAPAGTHRVPNTSNRTVVALR